MYFLMCIFRDAFFILSAYVSLCLFKHDLVAELSAYNVFSFQCLIRYAKEELNMALLLRREPYSDLMKSFCSLALLRFIRRGFRLLQYGGRVYGRMRPFLEYLNRRWVAHPVRRPWMCVYGSVHRTNNTCESHNRVLKDFTRIPRPSIYNFIGLLSLIFLYLLMLCPWCW